MTYQSIRLEHRDGVSTITLDRPPVNAVSLTLVEEALAALDALEARDATRCIVLTGAGTKAFSAGADLTSGPRGAEEAVRFRELGRRLVDRLETVPKPVIAAIRGWCIGGGFAIAMACDVRLASSTARFRTGDAYIGVVPSWGMSLVRLTHYIGRNRALDMLMLGEDTRRRGGPRPRPRLAGDLRTHPSTPRWRALATRVAGGAPITYRSIKETIRAQYWESPGVARELETRWAESWRARPRTSGRAWPRFREKRPPVFRGR